MKKTIRYILLLMSLLLNNEYRGYSQLTVDAGPDRAVCVNLYDMDTITFGGNPTASGGSGAYTYCWETLYHLSGSQYYWYASYFLDDTTSANPRLLHPTPGSDLVFHLTVKDSEDNIEVDSCRIIFSYKDYNTLGFTFYVPRGDSTILYYDGLISSTLPLDSIAWIPQTGVSSPHDPVTWVHPDSSTYYAVYIRDTAGCFGTSSPNYLVYIYPAETVDYENKEFEVFYDHQSQTIKILGDEILPENSRIIFFDIKGYIIKEDYTRNAPIVLPHRINTIIFYTITNKNKIIASGKILID